MGERGLRPRKRARNLARVLRTRSTNAEHKLWWELRGRRDDGLKFRRQHPVAPYVLDFAELSLKLAIEIDGWTHSTKEEVAHDEKRTAFLERLGWNVLRFPNAHTRSGVADLADRIVLQALAQRDELQSAPVGAPPSDPSGHLPPEGEGRVTHSFMHTLPHRPGCSASAPLPPQAGEGPLSGDP